MRIETTTRELFTFDELDEKAQEKALDACRDWNVNDSFWSDCAIDNIKEAGAIIGIDIDKVYFSGFWSQGDGACFEGLYSYAKGALPAIMKDRPGDTELHRIAAGLQALQHSRFYQLSARVRHSGYYYHSGCTAIDVFRDGDYADSDTADDVVQLLRDFMDWSYSLLEQEYTYLTSDECIRESLEANECEFLADGTPA